MTLISILWCHKIIIFNSKYMIAWESTYSKWILHSTHCRSGISMVIGNIFFSDNNFSSTKNKRKHLHVYTAHLMTL